MVSVSVHDIAIDIVRTPERFLALESEWDRLYRESSPKNPFLTYSWTRACWQTQGAPPQLFILTLRKGGKLIGLAPLCIETKLGFRVLRFIADGRSDYLGFLGAADADDVDTDLLRAVESSAADWDVAVLRQLGDSLTGIQDLSPTPTLEAHKFQSTTSAYCKWDGDWDSLHSGGPGWLRETRKRRRRFLREGGNATRFTGSEAIEQLDVVAGIEARSWKEREGKSRLQPGPGQELLRRAFETMAAETELWIAFVDDEPAAFQLAFVTPERLWLYQASYDERFSRTRAGSVLAYVAIEDAWQRGVREYDYLAGDEPYKLERTSALRPIYHLAAHRRTGRGRLAYALLIAPRWTLRGVPQLKFVYDALRSVRQSIRGSFRRATTNSGHREVGAGGR